VGLLPFVQVPEIDPEWILVGVLPPLLYSAAVRLPAIEFRRDFGPIAGLSVILVIISALLLGLFFWLVLPDVGFPLGVALGAILSPTDAVATSIVKQLGISPRVVVLLEGESLLNDATALVALNASIAAIVSVVTPTTIVLDFVVAVLVGVAIGLVVGFLVSFVRRALRSAVLDTSISLITPFAAFLIAELLHGSGVLAVVVTGLYLGFRAPVVSSAEARVAERLNWRTIQFLLENAVFLFIGLNLNGILQGAFRTGPGVWETVLICAGLLFALVASRFAWVLGTTALYRHGPRRMRERGWAWGNGIAVASAGVRGVVTLAAVFLLPAETPGREYLQFLAFVVVVASLLGGLALPWIIRRLRLPKPNLMQELTERRMLMAEARRAGIERLDQEARADDEPRVLDLLRSEAGFLGETLELYGPDDSIPKLESRLRLRRSMLDAERGAVLQARHEGRYQERAVAAALQAIDAEESALRAQYPRDPR